MRRHLMDPDYYKEKLPCDHKTINASKVLIRSKKQWLIFMCCSMKYYQLRYYLSLTLRRFNQKYLLLRMI